jgi:hypothetical protein
MKVIFECDASEFFRVTKRMKKELREIKRLQKEINKGFTREVHMLGCSESQAFDVNGRRIK